MQFKDYYEILGVPAGAAPDAIKSAYRRLARKFHPDVSKEKDAEERFKAINEAYEVLRDNQKRESYDQLRAGGYRPGEEFRPPPNWRAEHDFDSGDLGGAGFSDFFETLFGRGRPGATPGRRGPVRGQDLRARLEIDLETAYSGAQQRVQVNGKTLEVRIPAGVAPGQQIRLAGQGENGGALLLEIAYRPHRLFEVKGRNVTLRLPVAPWEAALGAAIAVPTLAGSVDMKIPPGSSTGRKLRLKGRGMPGPTPGDQYVLIEVQAPQAADAAQREAYDNLHAAFPDFAPRKGL